MQANHAGYMTIHKWLKDATTYLKTAGIETARLDALVLLEDCFSRERSWLLAHPEAKLSPNQVGILKNLLNRRSRHEPLAYLRGRCEFYSREFVLTPAVLQPRPESEAFIDTFKALIQDGTLKPTKLSPIHIADVGTGSGVLGTTIALEEPKCLVDLLDIDNKAVKVAKANVDLFTLNISVIVSDLLSATTRNYDALICNLPYVPDDYEINKSAKYEPKIAIFGGPDGLDIYRRLFSQLRTRQHKPLLILTESFPHQHASMRDIALQAGYLLIKTDDFIQVYQYKLHQTKKT